MNYLENDKIFYGSTGGRPARLREAALALFAAALALTALSLASCDDDLTNTMNGTVETPTANPPGGPGADNPAAVSSGTKVALSTETADAVIYYTTDGSDPGTSGLPYTDQIPVPSEGITIIRAYAKKAGMNDSGVLTASYKINVGDNNDDDNDDDDNNDGNTTYTVTIDSAITHGKITAEPESGAAGTEITLTVEPDDGYQLKEGTLKYNDTAVSGSGDTYTFTMPAANVTVSAEFTEIVYDAGLYHGTRDTLMLPVTDEALTPFSFDAAIAWLNDENAEAGEAYTIVIDTDEESTGVTLDASGTFPANVTIYLEGKEQERKVTQTGVTSLISLTGKDAENKISFILNKNIRLIGLSGTVDNGYNNNVIRINQYADFTMNKGTIIESKAATNGTMVTVGSSTQANFGNAKFIMTEAVLTGPGDVSDTNTRGVVVNPGATFTMTGGVIEKFKLSDASTANGAGVMIYGGTFTMTGGIIRNNKTEVTGDGYSCMATGAGVYMYSSTSNHNAGIDPSFIMNEGAIIANNTATTCGAGVTVNEGAFTMNGGEIKGNRVLGTTNYTYTTGTDQRKRVLRMLSQGIGVAAGGSAATFSKTGGTIYGVNEGDNSNCYAAGPGETISYTTADGEKIINPKSIAWSGSNSPTTFNVEDLPTKSKSNTSVPTDVFSSADESWTD